MQTTKTLLESCLVVSISFLLTTHREKRQLFISSILAFESLKFRNLLHRLDDISVQNVSMLNDVFMPAG